LEKSRAYSGLILQKLKSLAAATRAVDVHRLYQLVGSSPNAPRTSIRRLERKRRALLGGVVLLLVRVLSAESAVILAASQCPLGTHLDRVV
jgi:hypothetical protein